jgi:hypothetical protein
VHRDLAELVAQAAEERSDLRSGFAGAVQQLLRERLRQARGGHRMKDEDGRMRCSVCSFGRGANTPTFFYEADRGAMNGTDMLQKLRAYFHFIKRQQKHREPFGIHPVRAALIETPDEARGKKLMELVNHPLVCGPGKCAGRFWFTISPLFTNRQNASDLATYLTRPQIISDSIPSGLCLIVACTL